MPSATMDRATTAAARPGTPRIHLPRTSDVAAARGDAKLAGDVSRGSTAHFNVFYDSTLGAAGQAAADAILATCEADYSRLQGIFGGITPANLPFNVHLTTGGNGASHATCASTTITVGANSAPGNLDFMRSLLVAEADEVFEANFGHGWDCGSSNGEGLSRVLANAMYPAAEPSNFVSAPVWLDTPGRPDWVNNNEATDTDYVSIGCSVLFLNWLRYELQFSWNQIVLAGGSTLAQTYTNLTGNTDGWTRFKALMDATYPPGRASGLPNDNPFPLGTDAGRLEVFARGMDHGLWHIWQTAPNSGWSGWASEGGWIDQPSVACNADGRLEIFVVGADHALWHNWQTAPSGGWSGWDSLGGTIDQFVVIANQDGRLEVFARGMDGGLWHKWQTAANNGWSDWSPLGGVIDMLAATRNADGRIEIFARGMDCGLWHIWQTAPNNGWSDWDSLGGVIDRLAVGQNADGRLEVFARGMDRALWHIWQTTPSGAWSGWDSLGGWIDNPVVTKNEDGRLEVFVIGSDHGLWHIWQTAPSSGWSDWDSLGGWIDMIALGDNEDDRLEVFARGGDGAVWHIWQTAPNNGWSGWDSLGGVIEEFAIGKNSA